MTVQPDLQEALAVLRTAVDDALRGLRDLGSGPHRPDDALAAIMGKFAATAGPVQDVLARYADADPEGLLAAVRMHMRRAFGYLAVDEVDVTAALNEVVQARTALFGLDPEGDQLGRIADTASRDLGQ